tara:strand:+ start:13 stop:717 length:705 start_codon:yes stop_codon:yes gene_type:complete
MSNAPKILIAAPQSDVKNYCFLDWAMNINKFSYPKDKLDVLLVDNSDTQENIKIIEKLGMTAKYIPKNGRGIIETLAECHQICLDYAKDNGYDYLFHLETDVFPKHDILFNLLSFKKPITCGLYYIFDGAYREPMLRLIEKKNNGYMRAYGIKLQESLIRGQLMKVFSGALGCTLIASNVFKHIKFRFVEGENQHPDTWFAQDMYEKNIPIYVDTKSLCEHRSKSWGTFKLNFN